MHKILTFVFLLFTSNVFADAILLYDWGVNLNGNVISSSSSLPGNVTFSNDFFETGLGTVTMTFDSPTPQNFSVAMFFDHEIIQEDNTFFNEYGAIEGTPTDSRLLYEIDEPGWGNGEYTGDIYENFSNFATSGFDNQIFYDGYTDTYLSDFENPISDDVSMAIGWNFTLNGNETAVLEYTVSSSTPTTGFYLAQLDRNSNGTGVYLQSRLNISSANVPEPNILSLFGMGIVSLFLFYRSKRKHSNITS
jgi:hypothetical protein